MHITYVLPDGNTPRLAEIKDKFTGYEVQTQPSGALWKITELQDSARTGLCISFRPSKTLSVINRITTATGLFMQYNSRGEPYTACYYSDNGKSYGQGMQFSNNKSGSAPVPFYTYSDLDITLEVNDIVNNRTELSSEDLFNLYIKYGPEFKMYNEYKLQTDVGALISMCTESSKRGKLHGRRNEKGTYKKC